MHLLILWFRFYQPDGAIQYKYLNRVYFDCKTKLCLIVPDREGNYNFMQQGFYLQGILNNINEQDTSFLDYKHTHMMKSGAPPDKVGVLYCMLPTEWHGFTKKLISKGYHSLVPVVSQFY